MLKDFKKAMEESQKKWDKIKRLSDLVRKTKYANEDSQSLADLVLALIDYYQPAHPTDEQMKEITAAAEDLMKSIKGE